MALEQIQSHHQHQAGRRVKPVDADKAYAGSDFAPAYRAPSNAPPVACKQEVKTLAIFEADTDFRVPASGVFFFKKSFSLSVTVCKTRTSVMNERP
jgi:hypothetical protein